ncbi:hypothetical protein [Leptospira biflexa]|uniref:hypothetical protein n=1 Tax=Leptospira biflexa TaxID=172 RepID=UPI001082EDB7|nr:hypothetical protein [Leptospira biflexa]TGM36770.1 hypothetical protein EHQ89_08605 [Leptospira biflexa]TGM39755.1 hypothetical protein EHQ80_00710 [Leptospira biflexa]
MFQNFFQSKIQVQFPGWDKYPHLPFALFFTISSIINFLLCETIYFQSLYSADQLYSPLVLMDLFSGKGISHWYFPPSPYFFPDLVLMAGLYLFFPFLYMPTIYGVFQMALVQIGLYLGMLGVRSKKETLLFLVAFQSFVTIYSLFGWVTKDNPLPFVYFFSNAHHSTGFFFSLLLVCTFYQSVRKQEHRREQTKPIFSFEIFLYWIGFSFLYLSDRYSFSIGCIGFVTIYLYETKHQQPIGFLKTQGIRLIWTIVFFLFSNELFFWGMKHLLQIPNSFGILWESLSQKPIKTIFHLATTYLYDFGKQTYYQNRSLLGLLGFTALMFFRFPMRIRILFLVLLPVLLILLILVGRFTYLHPYPIRYLFPLWFFSFFGISWAMVSILKHLPYSFVLATLIVWVCLLSYFPKPREEVALFHRNQPNPEVSYDLEKPIRFWSEGKIEPIPIDKSGEPYRWITGAFHTP